MVRGENQPGKPFHRCVDPVHSDVLHPRCRFGIRGVWFGNAIVMDRRSGSLDGLAQDMAGMDSGHRQLRFRGVVRQDIRHGAWPIWAASSSSPKDRSIWRWPHSYVSPQSPCPGVILALGLDPTDLADGLVQILRLPQRFVYGGLAGMRMFTLLQDDWRALGQSRRSRGLGDGSTIKRVFSQAFSLLVVSIRRGNEARHRHGSARIRIRRATKPSARIETACGRLAVLRDLHRGAGNRVGHRILHRLLALGVQ